jgi:thioredoxin 1
MRTEPLDLNSLLLELNRIETTKQNESEETMKATVELNAQNFDQQVLRSDKPVVVDFWAEWCGPCKMLSPSLDQVAADNRERFVVAKVNVDDNPELAARYDVQSIPTLLYFAGGELRDRTVGVVARKDIANRLAALAQTQPN